MPLLWDRKKTGIHASTSVGWKTITPWQQIVHLGSRYCSNHFARPSTCVQFWHGPYFPANRLRLPVIFILLPLPFHPFLRFFIQVLFKPKFMLVQWGMLLTPSKHGNAIISLFSTKAFPADVFKWHNWELRNFLLWSFLICTGIYSWFYFCIHLNLFLLLKKILICLGNI